MDILETHAYDRRKKRNLIHVVTEFPCSPLCLFSLYLPLHQSYALLFSLLPFFFATAVYFYLWTPNPPASIMTAGVKATPILLLAAVVLTWNGGQSVLGVVGGLVFSAIGDICLVWPDLFIHGMGAFAVAHLLYSLTFLSARYAPRSSPSWLRFLYLILFIVGGCFYIYIYPYLQKDKDSGLLVPGVGIYAMLITIMGSLALRTRHLATLFGALIFMVSDIALAMQVFKATADLEHGNSIVMVTYYLAQLLIAVGDIKAVGEEDDFSKWKSS